MSKPKTMDSQQYLWVKTSIYSKTQCAAREFYRLPITTRETQVDALNFSIIDILKGRFQWLLGMLLANLGGEVLGPLMCSKIEPMKKGTKTIRAYNRLSLIGSK